MVMILIVLAVFSVINFSESARILGIVPTPSYSHQIVFRPIWNELSRKGHDVVVVTTDPENNPDLNITEIDISFSYDVWRETQVVKIISEHRYNLFKVYKLMMKAMVEIITQELLHPEIQNFLKNESEHFDLVIVEYLHPTMFAFSERFKCPYIGVVTLSFPNEFHALLGNPVHPIAYPDDIHLGLVGDLNFWERLGSVIYTAIVNFLMILYGGFDNNSGTKGIVEEHFGKDIAPLKDIMKNVSMVFINDNPAFNVRPLGPGFVLFGGGTHLTPLKPLPKVDR